MARRWIRLDVEWSQTEWVALLKPAARLAWVELLKHVKVHGKAGRCKAVHPVVFGRMYDIPAKDVAAMLEAAHLGEALRTVAGEWEVLNWTRYQEPDATSTDRKRRQRDREEHEPPEPEPESQDVTGGHGSHGVTSVTGGVTRHATTDHQQMTGTETGTSVSPLVTGGEEASSLPPDPFAHTHEEGNGERQQPEASPKPTDPTAQMRAVLSEFVAGQVPEPRQASFRAAAVPILEGLSSATWMGPDGGQVPAFDRPRLFAVALAKCAADARFGSNDLHSALRYVIPQQLDPHPAPKSRPPPDSQSARVRNEMPGRDRQHEAGGGVGLRGMDDWEWSDQHKRFMPKGIA